MGPEKLLEDTVIFKIIAPFIKIKGFIVSHFIINHHKKKYLSKPGLEIILKLIFQIDLRVRVVSSLSFIFFISGIEVLKHQYFWLNEQHKTLNIIV